MTDSLECQVIIEDRPNSGSWNMAFDEALLEVAVASGLCAARVYEWAGATLSLGYFQDPKLPVHETLQGLPLVRRLSGGGAILHHYELTYSCVVPPDHPQAREPSLIYDNVHAAIIALLAEWGIPSRLRASAEPGKDAAFLCFGRGDPRDILVGNDKIVGSAQRRRKGAVLQHGSVLLRRSEFAPKFPGALDLCPTAQLPEDANRALALAVGTTLGQPVLQPVLQPALLERAIQLETTRYNTLR